MKQTKQTEQAPVSPSSEEFECVVCHKTSSETPFNCRYRVHEKNEGIMCGFFGNEVGRGQLCDRCYRRWYKHKREQQVANGEIPIKSPKKTTGAKRKSAKDSPAPKKKRKKQRRVDVESSDVFVVEKSAAKPITPQSVDEFDFPAEKYARRLTRNAAAVTAALLSHTATSHAVVVSNVDVQQTDMSSENETPNSITFAPLHSKESESKHGPTPHSSTHINGNEHKDDITLVSSGVSSYMYNNSDAEDDDIIASLPKPDAHCCRQSRTSDGSSFRYLIQNFDRSLEDAKEQAQKRRKLSMDVGSAPSVLELIQEHCTTVPRKSRRKGTPFRAYPVDTSCTLLRKCRSSEEVYLMRIPNAYAE